MSNHRANTDWFRDARWGVFFHFLGAQPSSAGHEMSLDEWNRRVDGFDVQGLAAQLELVGAGYFFITIGQNSGHFCAPNPTYRALVSEALDRCSSRDLVADLYDALAPKGIRLLVYLPSGAPAADLPVCNRLGWEWGLEGGWPNGQGSRTGKRLAEFQLLWEAVVRDWSLRWGRKIDGWWIDGCYFADEMYRHPDPPNFTSFAATLKAGNPDSLVAFNPGVLVPVISHTEWEDYTAGEISTVFPLDDGSRPQGRFVDGAQYHILSYLGQGWAEGEPRFPTEFVVGYTKWINSRQGVITWDVPPSPTGLIPRPFFEQLLALNRAQEKIR